MIIKAIKHFILVILIIFVVLVVYSFLEEFKEYNMWVFYSNDVIENQEKNIIGDWKSENILFSFYADGTYLENTKRGTWMIKNNQLILNNKSDVYGIIRLSKNYLWIKNLLGNEYSHFNEKYSLKRHLIFEQKPIRLIKTK